MNKLEISFELYQIKHYKELKELMRLCFSDIGDVYASEEELQLLSDLYPRGQIVCLVDDKIVGVNLSRIVPFSKYQKPHNQEMCIDQNVFLSETEQGNSVYGLDVFVHPDYQNLKIGKMIVSKFIQNVFEDNFYCMMGISRVVNYSNYVNEMDCETYVQKVINREIKDPVLGFHLSYGSEFVNVSPNFSDDDHSSAGYGVTIAVYNPNFDATKAIYLERAKIIGKYLVNL
jgi:GNAT superfamily N-acetyltransferase